MEYLFNISIVNLLDNPIINYVFYQKNEKMKRWFLFYVTLLIALLVNGYFGVYKEMWTYAESINMLGISILCGANAYEYYLKKKKK